MFSASSRVQPLQAQVRDLARGFPTPCGAAGGLNE